MNLYRCSNCRIVVDIPDYLWPDVYDDYGDVIEENAEWYNRDYVSAFTCPLCKEKITKQDQGY